MNIMFADFAGGQILRTDSFQSPPATLRVAMRAGPRLKVLPSTPPPAWIGKTSRYALTTTIRARKVLHFPL
jgi:hypothetical protein